MSLRLKIYLIVGFVLVAGAAALFMVSQTLVMNGFDRLEVDDVRGKVALVRTMLDRELTDLGTIATGYCSGGESGAPLGSLEFLGGEAGPGDSSFAGGGVSVAVLVGADGQTVISRRFDGKTGVADHTPSELSPYVQPESPLVRHAGPGSVLSGLLMLPEGPMLVDSRPLFVSEDGRLIQGVLILGRWVGPALMAALEDFTGASVHIVPLVARHLPPEVREAVATMEPAAGAVVVPLHNGRVTGFSVLRDVLGANAAVLQVEVPRTIHGEGARNMVRVLFAFAGTLIIFGATAVGLLERSVFRRVGRLTSQVRRFRLGQNGVVPIGLKGNDELATLARAIGAGFTRLENTRSQQESQARTLSQALDELRSRHRDLEKAHRHLQQLQEASVSLSGSLEITDALGQLEHIVLDIFEADEVWLLRLHTSPHQLRGITAFSRKGAGRATLPQLFGCEQEDGILDQQANSLLKAVFSGASALFIESLEGLPDDRQKRLFRGTPAELGGFRSLALVPLQAEGGPIGLIISASVRVSEFPADKRSTILLFASQVAQALKNSRLYEDIKALGEIDSLSGLYNRRRSLEQLEMEVERARRYQGTFSLLIADVDNFKLFNDTYGHPVGDEIIKRVAGLLKSRSRTSDFVGRFGGDEFILILPETYRAGARILADHLRTALNSMSYTASDGASIPLRMSFGAASFPEDGRDAASLIAIADANLYESKRWGGDTITLRPEPIAGQTVDPQAFSTLDALVSAVDNKDHYTRRHSAQVAEHARAMAKLLGFDSHQEEMLYVAALLHDVGKIGVPDRILRKPGALTPEESEFMDHHSLLGSMMISQHLPDLVEVREAVLSHHERWDGKGYPRGLRGPDIPLLGRILAVADAYSAMVTDRPYRAALARDEALSELVRGSGIQFDPDIIRVFVQQASAQKKCAPNPGGSRRRRESRTSAGALS